MSAWYPHTRKEGYILHDALRGCVGRLRVFEQLQDLLQALFVWLPVHGARRTAGVGTRISAGSRGLCVSPGLSPRRWWWPRQDGSVLGGQVEAADPRPPKCGVPASCTIHGRAVAGSGARAGVCGSGPCKAAVGPSGSSSHPTMGLGFRPIAAHRAAPGCEP